MDKNKTIAKIRSHLETLSSASYAYDGRRILLAMAALATSLMRLDISEWDTSGLDESCSAADILASMPAGADAAELAARIEELATLNSQGDMDDDAEDALEDSVAELCDEIGSILDSLAPSPSDAP